MESKVIYFDFKGDLFHELSLLTGGIIVMGDFSTSVINGFLDYVKNFCHDENVFFRCRIA